MFFLQESDFFSFRFISISSHRHKSVEKDHDGVATSLHQIRRENEVAFKLRKNLEHEMIVLEERKQVGLEKYYCYVLNWMCDGTVEMIPGYLLLFWMLLHQF